MAMGRVSVNGGANLSEEKSIQSTHSDDCFLRAAVDRNTAVRYAYDAHSNGSGSVLQLWVSAVVASYGTEAVWPVSRKSERADLNIAEACMIAGRLSLLGNFLRHCCWSSN